MDTKKNVLIVAPHADDEVLGCGGIIQKYSNDGINVYVAIMTNAHVGAPNLFPAENIKRVRGEALKAHQFLKVKDSFFLDFPAPRLETHPSYEISDVLASIIRKNNIDTLFIPHKGDIHKDHVVIYYSSLVAARPINNCPVKEILAYETLSETEWAAPNGNEYFIPTVYIDISDSLPNKLKAMSFFTSQLKSPPHPRSLATIEQLAMLRGSTVGCKYAEAFMLVRSIR